MLKHYKVIGLRIEKYIGNVVEGHNCDFNYSSTVLERHVVLLKDERCNKYEVSLWTEESECGSGWCVASYGHMRVEKVNTFAEKTHSVKDRDLWINVDLEEDYDENKTLKCNAFHYDPVGGCNYYPNGSAAADKTIFNRIRTEDLKRPVYIFKGESDLRKSHIASLTSKSIYETDVKDTLPDNIVSDIIVVGNRFNFTLKEIFDKIVCPEDSQIILVNFTKYT